MKKRCLMMIILGQLFIACNKEGTTNECVDFKKALIAKDAQKVKAEIGATIFQLPDRTYTSDNLSRLAGVLSSRCDISFETLCFDCIDTNPSQSELKASFNSGGTAYTRIIDISYSASNNMVFRSLHD